MRKQLLGVVLPLLILVQVGAAADTQNMGSSATTHAALQQLNVVRGDDGVSVEITARGPVTPKLSTMSSPARVVIDLPNTVMGTNQHCSGCGKRRRERRAGGHERPEAAQHARRGRPREGLQVRAGPRHRQQDRGEVVHECHHRSGPATVPVTAAAPKATIKPAVASPFMAKLVPAAAITTPVVDTRIAAPAPAPKPVETAASTKPATDYVFVEPSYKPKDETKTEAKPATVEPSERALEAAAKFADKPASELLPVHASASMQPQAAQAASASITPAVNLAAEQKAQMSQTSGGERSEVHGRADLGKPERC